jgi:hypothetical protein
MREPAAPVRNLEKSRAPGVLERNRAHMLTAPEPMCSDALGAARASHSARVRSALLRFAGPAVQSHRPLSITGLPPMALRVCPSSSHAACGVGRNDRAPPIARARPAQGGRIPYARRISSANFNHSTSNDFGRAVGDG